ncbi:MAG TPA: hypothetical protein DCR93_21960 [Cytophagales bacterium]|nr:hypothetical protein [Cytophagales bacterium]HAP62046.1 hypothetical protein [Cytophagales bacterium]
MSIGKIDMSQYPVIVLRMAMEDPTVKELEAYFRQLDEEIGNRSGSYVVITMGNEMWVSSEIRVKLGNLINEIAEKYKHRLNGSIIVQHGMIARMMLRGIMLLVKQHAKVKVVSTEEEAMELASTLMGKGQMA